MDVINIALECKSKAIIVIKSTVPVGYTKALAEKYHDLKFIFCPEFLREGKALYDNLYPSRVIVGFETNDHELEEKAVKFGELIREEALNLSFGTGKWISSMPRAKRNLKSYRARSAASLEEIPSFSLAQL